MDYLKELNKQQLEAATTTEGYIRVVAGAGSGKTKTLTARFLYLVEMLGISTANILCVTFTNKAAAEMKKRIRRQLPDQDLGRITTFHGFCVGLLKEDCHVVQYPTTFIVLDEEDKEAMLRTCFEDLGTNPISFFIFSPPNLLNFPLHLSRYRICNMYYCYRL